MGEFDLSRKVQVGGLCGPEEKPFSACSFEKVVADEDNVIKMNGTDTWYADSSGEYHCSGRRCYNQR